MDNNKAEWLSGAFFHLRKRRFYLPHAGKAFLESAAVLALLLAVGAGAFAWRLTQGPIDMGFARDYLMEALRDPQTGIQPTVQDIALSWPDLNGPLLLGFKKAQILNTQGQVVLEVDEAALSLSKTALLIGRIAPEALILKSPSLNIVRTEDGSISFGASGVETTAAAKEHTGHGLASIYQFIARPGAEKSNSGLGALRALKIENARVVIEDKTLGSSWTAPQMDVSLDSEQDRLSGNIYLRLSDDASSFVKLDMTMPWDTKRAQVEGEMKNFDPWFFTQRIPSSVTIEKGAMSFDARIGAVLDEKLNPLNAIIQLVSAAGKFAAPDLAADGVSYKDLVLNASYDGEKKRLDITDVKLTAQDIPVQGKAWVSYDGAALAGSAHVAIPQLTQKKVAEIWPPAFVQDNAHEWIAEKLSDGTFSNLYADVDITGTHSDTGWTFDTKNLTTGFDFDGMTVHYRDPLTPVKNGKGSGKFIIDQELLSVKVTGGSIGDLAIKSGDLEFANIIEHGKGVADINVKLSGPLKSGFDYLSSEPISMKRKFDPAKVKGQADVTVNIDFPTRKDIKISDVKISGEGTLSDVTLPAVAHNLDLTGGALKMSVKGNLLNIDGPAALGGAPGTIAYEEFLNSEGQSYRDKVKAKINTTPQMREGMGINLTDFIDGEAPVDVTYTEYTDGRAEADVQADLGPAHLFVHPFDYDKKPGEAGTATLTAKLENGDLKEVTGLEVAAPHFALKKSNISFRKNGAKTEIAKGALGDFTIGDTKGSATFDVDQYNRYKINATSSFFDLAPFLNHDEKRPPSTNAAMIIDLSAPKMRGADGSDVLNGKFHIDMDSAGRYDALAVTATVGNGPVALDFRPDEKGIRTFQMDADNAGATLAAFGVYKNIRGGKLSVHGAARSAEDRDIEGDAQITDFRVVHAPTLARLVSALSLPGIAALLNNEGLGFSKLQAGYEWHYKPGGSVLAIKDGRTSGNSVGFTFEGSVNQADATVDIFGTVVPLSSVNKLIGKIPLVGDILTGGGGLIAATYTVRGPTTEPGVMVNPLSVLTPGILRKILFE